jgi:hypothetical protein
MPSPQSTKNVLNAVFSAETMHHDTEFQFVTLAADGSGLDGVDISQVKLLLDANGGVFRNDLPRPQILLRELAQSDSLD